jgi:uncharacterized protein (TIGR02594 family)
MASPAVKRIQEALKAKGFNPGTIDGVWGRNTINALRQYQKKQGLQVDGVIGPKTAAALFAEAAPTARPAAPLLPWFEEARHLMGTKEVLGPRNNPAIMDWATDLDVRYQGDDIPWCGLFVAHCVGSTLPDEPLPGNPLGARQWERFGTSASPRLGSVMVFWRESLASGKGHVGFYAGEDNSAYQILGGNQSEQVCLTWLAKDRFRGARWPTSGASLTSSVIRKNRDEGLSTNEA